MRLYGNVVKTRRAQLEVTRMQVFAPFEYRVSLPLLRPTICSYDGSIRFFVLQTLGRKWRFDLPATELVFVAEKTTPREQFSTAGAPEASSAANSSIVRVAEHVVGGRGQDTGP